MLRKILAIFAHPDDESFGPGGTLARYAREGVEVHILCVTKGEAGKGGADARTQELLDASRVLGVKSVEFLNFIDGELSNNKYHEIAGQIINKINRFKPQVLLTYDPKGNSGHLDHIAVSLISTYAFLHQKTAKRLFYYCRPRYTGEIEKSDSRLRNRYFIYFPLGYKDDDISIKIDVSDMWKIRVVAMKKHTSQIKDIRRIIRMYKIRPKVENFLLFDKEGGEIKKLNGFFEGIFPSC